MRRLLWAVPILMFAPTAQADEAADLAARVLKACAADPADLKKLRTYTSKAKGTALLGRETSTASYEIRAVWPGQFFIHFNFGDKSKKQVVMAVSEDRGWQRNGEFPAADLGIEDKNDFRTDVYSTWVYRLVTLTEEGTKLELAPPAKINGEPVVGLVVARRPWPPVTLYFDEKTALLRRAIIKSRELGLVTTKQLTFDAHKSIGGVMLPTKQITVVEGREMFNWTEIEYTFPDKIDPKVFEKP